MLLLLLSPGELKGAGADPVQVGSALGRGSHASQSSIADHLATCKRKQQLVWVGLGINMLRMPCSDCLYRTWHVTGRPPTLAVACLQWAQSLCNLLRQPLVMVGPANPA